MSDPHKPPTLTRCAECGFGHVGDHTPEECLRWKKTSADPCTKCGHGKMWHDARFGCVQAIAGGGVFGASFCGLHDYEAKEPA